MKFLPLFGQFSCGLACAGYGSFEDFAAELLVGRFECLWRYRLRGYVSGCTCNYPGIPKQGIAQCCGYMCGGHLFAGIVCNGVADVVDVYQRATIEIDMVVIACLRMFDSEMSSRSLLRVTTICAISRFSRICGITRVIRGSC